MTENVKPCVLATDLDGTLIPLDGDLETRTALHSLKQLLAEAEREIVFVTGRHLESVLAAINEFELPIPDWILCDVGSSLYHRGDDQQFHIHEPYVEHLETLLGHSTIRPIRERLQKRLCRRAGLRLQEEQKQGRFKLSYYCEERQVANHSEHIEAELREMGSKCQVIASVDPFNHDGLIDLLPTKVSKAYALQWWAASRQLDPGSILFAGDSGNDLAALTAGFKTIVVGNASAEIKQAVLEAHRSAGHPDRVWVAESKATSAVLDGCYHFGMFG